ncbi:hypothetical protein HIM_08268 [Hirsutella minnesotensis 3608]|uniref:Heme haloperoxidase family profile domain-containing protein n=1 Tax=Hirsutella minnesotensis 3608 TaxID=1043627 RepID=A0A0F7ZYE7_9HYPO|nr:hypothetical protein HIM_08268 [Hirsutella minnesotensis 3608]
MPWLHVIPLLLLLLPLDIAVAEDRPNGQSICDFYAKQRYGESNSTTQLRLMQGIVAYAYAGGSAVGSGKDKTASTGIFNHGQYDGRDVYLRSWFDGSKPVTNLNGEAFGVDWLDGGGTEPLTAFLNGSTETAEIKQGSNQEKMFNRWYLTFGKLYGCSRASSFLEKSFVPPTPAYVHKYMNLNQTHIGYFIDQLIVASKHHGFSDKDAKTLSTFMNARYNTRCAPPQNGELYSICIAEECPLAAPEAQCEAYVNVQQYGLKSAVPSTTETLRLPPSITSGPTSTHSDSLSSPGLSAGAIAGISIGAAAVILLAVAICLFIFRRRQPTKTENTPAVSHTGAEAYYAYPPHSPGRPNPHDSYYSQNPHDSYMVSSHGSPSPGWVPWKTPQHPPQELGADVPEVTPRTITSPIFRDGDGAGSGNAPT